MGSDTPRVYRADRDWEGFGLQDPYWAVLTETRFRGATMSQGDRDRLRAYLEDYCRQDSRVRRFLRHWPDAERVGDDPGA